MLEKLLLLYCGVLWHVCGPWIYRDTTKEHRRSDTWLHMHAYTFPHTICEGRNTHGISGSCWGGVKIWIIPAFKRFPGVSRCCICHHYSIGFQLLTLTAWASSSKLLMLMRWQNSPSSCGRCNKHSLGVACWVISLSCQTFPQAHVCCGYVSFSFSCSD